MNSQSISNIIIDIGHARGTGARSLDGRWEEHELCTHIGAHLQRLLAAAGHAVHRIDFPDATNRDDLNRTIAAANALPGAGSIGISLHMDAASSGTPCGAHVCYYSGTGKRIAAAIAGPLCTMFPGRADRIVSRADLAVLRRTRAPWVLCECGFITNQRDRQIVVVYPERVAAAIAEGVAAYAAAAAK